MGLLDAVVGIGTSLLNRHSQKETNKTNARINEENNAFNAEQAKLQRDWSAGQSQLDRDFNAQQSQLQRDFSTAERESQQDWQERMIQQQNEYNAPANQLKMMREAGISTATFDGALADAASPTGIPSGAASSAAQAGGPRSGATASASPSIPMQAPEWNMLSLAQADLMRAQADSVRDANDRANQEHPLRMDLLGKDVEIKAFDLSQMLPAQRDKLQAECNQINENIKEITSRIDVNKAYEHLYTTEGKIKENELEHWTDTWLKQIEESNSRISLNRAQAKECLQRIAESVAKVHLMEKEGQLIDEQVKGQIITNGLAGLQFDLEYKGHNQKLALSTSDYHTRLELNKISVQSAKDDASIKSYGAKIANWKEASVVLMSLETLVSSLGYPLGAGFNMSKQVK